MDKVRKQGQINTGGVIKSLAQYFPDLKMLKIESEVR